MEAAIVKVANLKNEARQEREQQAQSRQWQQQAGVKTVQAKAPEGGW